HEHTDASAPSFGSKGCEKRPSFEVGAVRAARLLVVVAIPNASKSQFFEIFPAFPGIFPREILVRTEPDAHGAGDRHSNPPNSCKPRSTAILLKAECSR